MQLPVALGQVAESISEGELLGHVLDSLQDQSFLSPESVIRKRKWTQMKKIQGLQGQENKKLTK